MIRTKCTATEEESRYVFEGLSVEDRWKEYLVPKMRSLKSFEGVAYYHDENNQNRRRIPAVSLEHDAACCQPIREVLCVP